MATARLRLGQRGSDQVTMRALSTYQLESGFIGMCVSVRPGSTPRPRLGFAGARAGILSETTGAMDDEVPLVEAARSGDHRAWNALIRRYRPKLYGRASILLRNAHEAEDVVQEVCVRAFRRISTLGDSAKFKSWIWRVWRRCILDALRTRRRNRGRGIPLEDIPEPMSGRDEEETLVMSLEAERLLEILLKLPPKQADVLYLRLVENMTGPEIAEYLRISTEAAYKRLQRAFEEFRRRSGGYDA